MLRFLRPRATTRATGAQAEDEALARLQSAGLTLIARNFNARGGEIDLIMRDQAILVFIEVRFRAKDSHGDGLDSVGAVKQRRLTLAARQFIALNPAHRHSPMRFDVVALGAGGFRWERDVICVGDGW